MHRFINLGIVGEGSYGMVFKCIHKASGQLVAIKKTIELDCDYLTKKTVVREIRMLRQLKHSNLINLLEIFHEKKELYLVLEYMDTTLLDRLGDNPNGLDENTSRKTLWQVLKGTQFIHSQNVIHRDLKPENILMNYNGIVKICDFGFARKVAQPGEVYTDYVATRWYRAPELLIADTRYGRAVDIWAIGCILAEMLSGEPLFPGDSDIDQLYLIIECFGSLTQRHKEVFRRSPLFIGMKLPEVYDIIPLEDKLADSSALEESFIFLKQCLQIDSEKRLTCSDLLKHILFVKDGFHQTFPVELKKMSVEQRKTLVSKAQLPENNNTNENSSRFQRKEFQKKKKEVERKDYRHHLRNFKDESKSKNEIRVSQNCSLRAKNTPSYLVCTASTGLSRDQTRVVSPACDGNVSYSNFEGLYPASDGNVSYSNFEGLYPACDGNVSCSNSVGLYPFLGDDQNKNGTYCRSSARCLVTRSTADVPLKTKSIAVKKGCRLSNNSLTHHPCHYPTPFLQQESPEKNFLRNRVSTKRTQHIALPTVDKTYIERSSISLPEVKGASAQNHHQHGQRV